MMRRITIGLAIVMALMIGEASADLRAVAPAFSGGGGGGATVTGTPNDVANFGSGGALQDSGITLNSLAPLASPLFTGTPTLNGYTFLTSNSGVAPLASPAFTGSATLGGYGLLTTNTTFGGDTGGTSAATTNLKAGNCASNVNCVSITGAATGTGPTIAPLTGQGDTNENLNLAGKGSTGSVNIVGRGSGAGGSTNVPFSSTDSAGTVRFSVTDSGVVTSNIANATYNLGKVIYGPNGSTVAVFVDTLSNAGGEFGTTTGNGASVGTINSGGTVTVAMTVAAGSTGISTNQVSQTVTTITAGATPALVATNGLQTVTLAQNEVPTITGIAAGQRVTFQICQNATGGFTWTWPAAIHGGMTISSTASTCSIQSFDSFSGTTLEAESGGITGIAP